MSEVGVQGLSTARKDIGRRPCSGRKLLWGTHFLLPAPKGHTLSFWMSQLQSLGVATEKGPAGIHLHAALDPWPEPDHMMLNR